MFRSVFPGAGAIAVAIVLAAASPAIADGLQAGLWKITSKPEINGVAAPDEVKTRCLTPEQVADLDKTFSPEHRTQNSACERVEHESTPTRLTWRLQCTGQLSIDVAGEFNFDSPQHYTAVISTKAVIGPQQMSSRVTVEGELVGECQ